MLKLMKYELIKQKTSKIIIGAVFLLLEIVFLVGGIIKNEDIWILSSTLLMLLAIITLFIVALEAIFTYSHDLRDKSGYMLFMTPHSVYTIMGSKILTSIVSIIIATIIFVVVAFLDITFIFSRYGELKVFFEGIQNFLREMSIVDISWYSVSIGIIYTLFEWISVVTSGFLAITLCMTIVSGMRGKGFISFILFWVINILFSVFVEKFMQILNLGTGMAAVSVMAILTVIFASVCFFFCGYMLERELSL